ncbi:MAG: SIMPL domain-containing protein [Armatimonadota bacterium]|nr:SIMPL domain-containing protein [Armatimonadota bacterium]
MRWMIAFALLGAVAAAPAAAQIPDPGRNQIATTGTGRADVMPDVAALTLGAQVQRASAADAMAEAHRIAGAVIARWRALGLRPEDIRTAAVGVTPFFTPPRDGGAPQVAGYRAVEMLTATVTDLTLVGRALDAGIAAGANQVSGITFGLRDPSRARGAALAAAVRDAREKAEVIAQAAGLRITGIERMVEESAAVQARELRIAAGAAAPIEPGLVTVTAQVSMTFRY